MNSSDRAAVARFAVLLPTVFALGCSQAPTSAPPPESGPTDEKASSDSPTLETQRKKPGGTSSKLKPTRTHAALRLSIVNKNEKPIDGIVICLVGPDGTKHYADATDAKGYTEVLVPKGQTYEIVYISLGGRDESAKMPVPDKPNFILNLILQYRLYRVGLDDKDSRGFVLKGVHFQSGKATLTRDSHGRLDTIVEFMKHKESAYIEISGHTDNVGDPGKNKTLSQKRAEACRNYIVSQGIDAKRIQTVGYGDEKPIAPNKTKEGRRKNRRIEAIEL